MKDLKTQLTRAWTTWNRLQDLDKEYENKNKGSVYNIRKDALLERLHHLQASIVNMSKGTLIIIECRRWDTSSRAYLVAKVYYTDMTTEEAVELFKYTYKGDNWEITSTYELSTGKLF